MLASAEDGGMAHAGVSELLQINLDSKACSLQPAQEIKTKIRVYKYALWSDRIGVVKSWESGPGDTNLSRTTDKVVADWHLKDKPAFRFKHPMTFADGVLRMQDVLEDRLVYDEIERFVGKGQPLHIFVPNCAAGLAVIEELGTFVSMRLAQLVVERASALRLVDCKAGGITEPPLDGRSEEPGARD